jgi:hypothetical protein
LEEEKKNMAQAHAKCTTMIQEEITTQALESLVEKTAQVQERGMELADRLHILEEAVEGVHTS